MTILSNLKARLGICFNINLEIKKISTCISSKLHVFKNADSSQTQLTVKIITKLYTSKSGSTLVWHAVVVMVGVTSAQGSYQHELCWPYVSTNQLHTCHFFPVSFFFFKCTRKFSEIYCHQSHVNAMYTWKFSEIYCHQFHVNTLYFNRFEFFKLKWKAPGSWKVSDLRLKFNYLLLAINSITEISC